MPIYSFTNNTLGQRSLVFARNKREAYKILELVDYVKDLSQVDEFCTLSLLKNGYGAYRAVADLNGNRYNEFFTFKDIK